MGGAYRSPRAVCVCVCVGGWVGVCVGGGHTHTRTMSPYTLQLNKEAVKEKEDDKVLIWRDHYTAAVLQCLMNTSNSTI